MNPARVSDRDSSSEYDSEELDSDKEVGYNEANQFILINSH